MKRFITMKWIFAGSAGLLTLLSLVAWWFSPPAAAPGKLPLTWVSDSNPLREEQAHLFDQTAARYEVSVDPANNDLQKVIVQCIGGVGPDLFDCFDGYQLTAYVRSGVAMDVTDELRARGIDVASQTFKGAQGAAILDGRVYGVPTNIAADGTWFHRDMFDAAGLPYPSGPIRWPEMIRLAQRLTVRDSSGRISRFGLLLPWWNWRHVFMGFGARVFTPDGTQCVVDSPEGIAAVQLMYDLIYRYHVSPSPSDEAGMTSQGGFGSSDIDIFGAKRAAMAIGGRWWLAQLRNFKGLRLGVFESAYQSARMFRAYGRATLVNRATKHPGACLDFLSFLASPAYNELVDDQADGISAFPQYDHGERFLRNPKHPEEDQNAVWADISAHSEADQVSPFVDGNLTTRLLQNQFDLIQNNLKTPAQAMHDAARDVNLEIQKSVQEDPSLARRWRALAESPTRAAPHGLWRKPWVEAGGPNQALDGRHRRPSINRGENT